LLDSLLREDSYEAVVDTSSVSYDPA